MLRTCETLSSKAQHAPGHVRDMRARWPWLVSASAYVLASRRIRLIERMRIPIPMSRCTKLGDWRAVALRGSLFFWYNFQLHLKRRLLRFNRDRVRPCVVSHLNAKATQFAMGGIDLFQEKSRNLNMIAGLLISCNSVR
jgi:hypothetical protein